MDQIMRRTAIAAACALTMLGLAGCADNGLPGGGGSGSPSSAAGGSDSGERNSTGKRPYYPGSLENPGAPAGYGNARGAN